MGGVPLLDSGEGVGLHALFHTHVIAQLLQGVGAIEEFARGVVALGARTHGGVHVGLDVGDGIRVPFLRGKVSRQLVQEHFLPVVAPHQVGAVARLAGAGAAGKQRAAEGLVAVALAVLVQPQAFDALHGGQRNERMTAHIAAGGDFHLGADAHGHGDAGAVATGHGRAILVLAQFVVLAADGVVHSGVAADVAAGEHHGATVVLGVLTGVGVLGDDAGDLGAVLVVHKAHGGLPVDELGAGGLGLFLRALDGVGHAYGAAELAGAHIRSEGPLLVVVPLDNGPVEGNELVLLGLSVAVDEPVEGLAGAIGELGEQRRLHTAGAVHLVLVHEVDNRILRNADSIELPGRVQMADVVAERAEGVLGLHFNDDDLRAELCGTTGGGGAGMARAAHDNVGFLNRGDLVFGDLGFLPEPAGTEHLAHSLALVARGGSGASRGGHGLAAARIGSVRRAFGLRAASSDHARGRSAGSHNAGALQKAATAQRDAPALIGQGLAQLIDVVMVLHPHPLSRAFRDSCSRFVGLSHRMGHRLGAGHTVAVVKPCLNASPREGEIAVSAGDRFVVFR